ncbi:MAG: PE-PPE domain-containing protein, partial [Actinomycetes bacterium]
PAAPVESPMEWTASSSARRSVSVARSAAAVQAAAATQPVILGPSGVPIPSTNYVNTVMDWYVTPNSPGGVTTPQVVFTPEGLYPITGVKSLPLNTSVDQGMKILSDTLYLLPFGTPTTVFGYSQSAILGALLQSGYISPTSPYTYPLPGPIPAGLNDSLNFVFVGNEMNPNGGFLSRFPDLTLPSLGIDFYGATLENAYPTTNYTREYDGFADFPRYPLNILADLNAGLGIVFVHTKYAPAANCQTFCLTQQEVEDAIVLPTTSPTQKYYFIPTKKLPLLEPLRLIPLIGNPIADLIQPVLKVIVNLGYGDPAHGFTSATQPDANTLVTFGLFPDVSPVEVLSQLVAGVQQGVSDFIADFGSGGSIAQEISAISLPNMSWSSSLSLPTADGIIGAIQNVITAIANRISFSAAGLYAALLPTADIVNAIAISLPAYDVNLALDGLQQAISGDPIGGLINAIGLPIAADVGLVTTASLIGVLVWAQAAVAVLFPNYVIGT